MRGHGREPAATSGFLRGSCDGTRNRRPSPAKSTYYKHWYDSTFRERLAPLKGTVGPYVFALRIASAAAADTTRQPRFPDRSTASVSRGGPDLDEPGGFGGMAIVRFRDRDALTPEEINDKRAEGVRVMTYLEQTARGLKPESGELPGEALNEWAARIEAILTEPRGDEPIP